ncbi:MAG: GntR family transcriptional regulator [Novosphingobium sp.]
MREPPASPRSTVTRIAQGVRTIALSMEPGGYVGSEESLSRKFNVTGPTLRQAIRLLEHEQIIQVRRGVRGGYFADRPNIDTISRVAAVYLRSRLASLDETTAFLEFIQPLLIDLVMASPRLGEMEEFARPAAPCATYEAMIAAHVRFVDLLWDIADNAPMQLVYAIFFQVGSGVELEPVAEPTEAHRLLEANRIELAQALLDKDRARAIELAVDQARAVHGGIKRNLTAAQQRVRGECGASR